MSFYLVEAKRGLVLGCFGRRALPGRDVVGMGWTFTPFTSARRSSRFAHATKEAACIRFMTPTSQIVECTDIKDAIRKAKEMKAAYDQQAPIAAANHAITQAITDPLGTT